MTRPYRRVVGVETASGLIACRFAVSGTTEPIDLTVTDEMAAGVANFFDQHIADIDPEQERSGHPGPLRYNCHIAALALQGVQVANTRELDARMEQFCATASPITGPLAAGWHGIVINREIEDLSHSFVGLGEDSPYTLQVVNQNSNLALLPYDQLVPEYSRHAGGQYVLAA
jgi:hypothetical protein